MTNGSYPILAREGRWHIVLSAGAALAVHFLAGPLWAVPFWIVLVFNLQFFRDPPRNIPDAPGAVICPADGRVVKLEEVGSKLREMMPWIKAHRIVDKTKN